MARVTGRCVHHFDALYIYIFPNFIQNTFDNKHTNNYRRTEPDAREVETARHRHILLYLHIRTHLTSICCFKARKITQMTKLECVAPDEGFEMEKCTSLPPPGLPQLPLPFLPRHRLGLGSDRGQCAVPCSAAPAR